MFSFTDEKYLDVKGVAYGLGVDSTAMLVGLWRRGIRPDFILFADVGAEKQSTYDYLPIIQEWLKSVGFPQVTVVKYMAPLSPYDTIEGNMVMNATLPGAAFGRASCTVKWKIAPQDKWSNNSTLCQQAWDAGDAVTKMIGFNAGEDYRKLRATDKAHTGSGNGKYTYEYPLIDWGWDRDECKRQIAAAGLPVPPKSACIFCPNMKPEELTDLTESERGRIARVEVTAEPYNKKVHGLWRRPRKRDNRPGSITHYMINNQIPFTHPDKLPDPMPLNPKCAKSSRGYTFHGPHDAPCLSDMIKDMVCEEEDRQHRDIIESL